MHVLKLKVTAEFPMLDRSLSETQRAMHAQHQLLEHMADAGFIKIATKDEVAVRRAEKSTGKPAEGGSAQNPSPSVPGVEKPSAAKQSQKSG